MCLLASRQTSSSYWCASGQTNIGRHRVSTSVSISTSQVEILNIVNELLNKPNIPTNIGRRRLSTSQYLSIVRKQTIIGSWPLVSRARITPLKVCKPTLTDRAPQHCNITLQHHKPTMIDIVFQHINISASKTDVDSPCQTVQGRASKV